VKINKNNYKKSHNLLFFKLLLIGLIVFKHQRKFIFLTIQLIIDKINNILLDISLKLQKKIECSNIGKNYGSFFVL